jgi:hypothetical protein
VPHTWQTAGLDHPVFRNIAEEVWPDDPPFTPKDVNPTGAYVRDFDVPANWRDRSTFLRFEGVTSGYFVWVDGKYVGHDQGGYTPAEFDITDALRPGRNRVAVQVHRWGSGSYLEDYDQWRYSGIFRSVWLYATPRTHIRDVAVTTDLDDTYTDATLSARVSLTRERGGPLTVSASLRDGRGREVSAFRGTTETDEVTLSQPVRNPAKWTDETPNLYTLVLSVGGHITSEVVGFREIAIVDRQLKVNGERVLFKGVNRAETDPDHGRHVPRARQEQDVRLMEQLNVNAVRTSHYPSPERLAEQAASTAKPVILGEYAHAMGNSLGNFREFWDVIRANPRLQGGFIWDWAEQNIREELRVTPDGSGNDIMAHLSGRPEVVDGHRGKALDFSGLDDFVEVYRDPRLEITGTALTLDAWVEPDTWTGDLTVIAKGDHAYALRMKDETTLEFFIHSGTWRTVHARVPADFYGNWHRLTGTYDGTALRLFIDGAQVGSTPFTGAIDRTFYEVNIGRNPEVMQDNHSGRMANGVIDDVRIYDRALPADVIGGGGDPAADAVLALDFDRVECRGSYPSYGESLSGVDGLVGSDRFLQPETAQLAWVHQPLRFSYADGVLSVRNERSFASTAGSRLRWKVVEGARAVAGGGQALDVAPGATAAVRVPVPANPGDVERFLNVEVIGEVEAHDQFPLGGSVVPGARPPDGRGAVELADDAERLEVSGPGFRYAFGKATGTLDSMRVRDVELLVSGPELDAWRAPLSNEPYSWGTAEGELRRAAGLDRLRTSVGSVTASREPTGGAVVEVRATVAAADRTPPSTRS